MIGEILDILGGVSGAAEALAEKAERGQLLEAGEARAVANGIGGIHAKLQAFKAAADRVDRDGAFADRVRDAYTIDG